MARVLSRSFRREAGVMPPDRPAVGAVEIEVGVTDDGGDTEVWATVSVGNPTADPFEEVHVEIIALDERGLPIDSIAGKGGPLPAVGLCTVEARGYFMRVHHDRLRDFEVRVRVVDLERIGASAELVWED